MTHKGNTAMTAPTVTPVGAWTHAGDLPTPAAWYGQHDGPVLLGGGKAVVAGGQDAAGASVADTAVFDPAAGMWRPADALHTARRLHSLTLLPDGKILVAGGLSGSAGLSSAELYDPDTGKWTTTGSLGTARWAHSAALLPDGSVLVAGGVTTRAGGGVTALRSAERYQ